MGFLLVVALAGHGRPGWRGPRREQAEPLGGRGSGFGGVDEEHEAGFGGDGEFLVGEGELADDGVTEPLGAGAVGADVVVGPQSPELIVSGVDDGAVGAGYSRNAAVPSGLQRLNRAAWAWVR
jgi:hypothetical protein